MSADGQVVETLRSIEALMLEKFRTEPFHNLGLLLGREVADSLPGGTCSDKTLSFCEAARRQGVDVGLHSACIDGEDKHRLARVRVDGRTFFADVGNGWPALKLYPADREIAYRCFGIGFRTELVGSCLSVYCDRRGRETLQLELDVRSRPEQEILAAIRRRFDSGVVYPFSGSVRFALVVGDRFLFLRGDRLEIHGYDRYEAVEGIGLAQLPRVLSNHFGLDLRQVRAFDRWRPHHDPKSRLP